MKLTDHYDENLEKILTAIFGAIGIIAILINVHLKGYGIEDWLDGIKDIASLLVVIAVFLVARRSIRNSQTHYSLAREALQKLQSKYPQILMGPRYNRVDYDSEKGKGLEYLFVTNENKNSTQRASLVPVQPLEQGCLFIYVHKGTLVDGLNYGSSIQQDDLPKVQTAVKDAVEKILNNKYFGKFDTLKAVNDSVIAVDFNESEMSKKQYARAIYDCTEAATQKLLEFRKPKQETN